MDFGWTSIRPKDKYISHIAFINVYLKCICVFCFFTDLFLQIFGAFLCQRPEQQTSLRRAAHVTACQPQVLLPSSPLHHQDVLAQPPSQAVPQHSHHHRGQSPGPGSPQLFSQWLYMHALHVTFQQNHTGHQQALCVQQHGEQNLWRWRGQSWGQGWWLGPQQARSGLLSCLSWLLIKVHMLFDFNNRKKHFFFSVDLSVREECDKDPSQSDETEAEMSPPKSPSTPKNVKSKNSGIVSVFLSLRRSWLI